MPGNIPYAADFRSTLDRLGSGDIEGAIGWQISSIRRAKAKMPTLITCRSRFMIDPEYAIRGPA